MAKKVTIEGSNLLQDIQEDWGGQNNTAQPQTVHGTTVPAGAEWGMNRGEVERIVKKTFGERIGAFRWVQDDVFYKLQAFATVADRQAYILDPEVNAGKLVYEEQLPISTVKTDSYRVQLTTSRTGSSEASPFILQRGNDWTVPVRMNAWHIRAEDSSREAMGASTTLIVERSQNGTSWTEVRRMNISGSMTETGFPLQVNIGPSVDLGVDAAMQVRLRIEPIPYEQGSETHYMSATPLTLYIRTVTLALSMPDAQWQQAREVGAGTQNLNGLTFNVLGNVTKTLHLKLTNSAGTVTYDNTFAGITAIGEYSVNAVDNNGTMGLTASGVHSLEAWLTCQSIDGTTIESAHVRHQLMVVNRGNTAGAMQRRVLLQQMADTVDNFVQSEVCRYMVWNPKAVDGSVENDTTENVQTRFVVADIMNLDEEHKEYLSLPVSVKPGVAYTLSATMEVEDDTSSDTYAAYLHAIGTDGAPMLLQPEFLTVDNTAGLQPVAGSVFHLNPKTRDNDEAAPQTIVNARDNATYESEWTGFKMDGSDGYTTDESGEKVLRVPAGRRLTIKYNPFAWFYNSPSVSKGMTLDFDFCVRNITNEDDPVLRLAEYQQSLGAWLGLMLKPLDGTMIGVTSGTNIQETDFRWAEGRRQHLSISIIPNVQPNEWGDIPYNTVKNTEAESRGTIHLVRVALNGTILRETRFTPGRANEFCTTADNGGIVIGQTGQDGRGSGCDIDIYGIRVWQTGLKPAQQSQNWISTIPDGTTKRRIKKMNDILRDDNSGRLSLAKVKEGGKNALVWHGDVPLIDDDKKKGWAEVSVYDDEGNYLPEYSGTFCKATKNLQAKGQGTTAMTYYFWNMQVKLGDVTDTIQVAVADFHESIHLSDPFEKDGQQYVSIYGGNLGKDFPVGNGTKDYPYADGYVTVPDGWVDGSGKYRGMCWQAGPNRPLSQKLVLKINYASSMQSHLIGVNWLYNALHTAYCGENSLQRATPAEYKAQVAKQVQPVLFFVAGKGVEDTQQTESTAVYLGPGGFGPGKMDKPTWGYSSKYAGHKYFGMFEGAVNNSILSDMLAPWDDTDHIKIVNGEEVVEPAKVKYFLHDPANPANKDPEAFFYRRTSVDADGNEVNNWEKGIGFDAGAKNADDKANDGESPSEDITAIIRNAWNYLYLHNPNINLYRGTFDDFKERDFSETELKQKWVCRANGASADNYLVKRYDFCERRWVDAGLWNADSHAYAQIDIRDFPGMDWSGMSAAERNDHAAVLAKYKRLLMAEAYPTETNEGIGKYFKVSSLRFHYAFVNLFIAGTDNCSKNTYYVIDPETKLIELHQDDVDTVLATDNYGYQTKPYYIDRKHPYPDGSTVSGYDGMNNGLFDIVEALWLDDDSHTIAQTLGEILNLMAQLTGGLSSPESEGTGGVWRALNRYLFNIQRWIPQVAYNEAARIRYEFPAMLGYSGRDGEARPLAQSCGDQLEAEIQFMRRRLVYMASYAGFGEFSPSIGAGRQTTGIDDLGAIFSIPVTALPNGSVPQYTFRLVPHQYIYPCFYQEGNQKQTFHRTAPGEEYEYTVPNLSVNDYAVVLTGLNYFRSIGNVGDMSTPANRSIDLTGARLTSFVAEPTKYYPTAGGDAITKAQYDALEDKSGYLPAFRPTSINVPQSYAATRLQTLSLNGCKTVSSSEAIPLDLSRMTLAQDIDLRGTGLQAVDIPQTATLTSLRLPATLTSLRLEGQPSLSTVSVEGVDSLTELSIGEGLPFNSGILVDKIHLSPGKKLRRLTAKGVRWTGIAASMLTWVMSLESCSLSGSIALSDGEDLPYNTVIRLIDDYGDIQDENNSLYVDYQKNIINSFVITGVKYVSDKMLDGEIWNGWGIEVAPAKGNNIAISGGRESLKWELIGDNVGDYAEVVDDVKGIVRVSRTQISARPLKFTLRVTMKLTSGGTVSHEKSVGFATRIPVVGDFAYLDGTFDDELDRSKKLAGTVVKRDVLEWYDTDKTIPKKCTLWVYNKENCIVTSTDKSFNQASMPWGLYPDANNANGFSSGFTTAVAEAAEMGSATDVNGSTDNLTTSGLTDPDNESSKDYRHIRDTFLDPDKNDGYAVLTSGGCNDFDTVARNERIISHAQAIILKYLGESLPETVTELADQFQNLVAKMTADGVSAPNRYRQLYYPAAYACYLYEPATSEGDVIDEQYKKHRWMLPSEGLLARIYNFYYNSCGRVTYEDGGRISVDSANENPQSEALLPLFANLQKRINAVQNTSTPFTMPTNSYYWSCTELSSSFAWLVYFYSGAVYNYHKYYSNVVRPVAAFTFEL